MSESTNIENQIEAFLSSRKIYKIGWSEENPWSTWDRYNIVSYTGDSTTNENRKDWQLFSNSIEEGDVLIAQTNAGNASLTYGIGVASTGYNPESPDLVDSGIAEYNTGVSLHQIPVNWVTVASNGEMLERDPPEEFPSGLVTEVDHDFFKELIYGIDQESYPPNENELIFSLQTAAALKDIDSIIDHHLPAKWKNTNARKQKIESVVKKYLTETDTRNETSERRVTAQDLVAARRSAEKDTVQRMCTSEIWDSSVEAGNYLDGRFDSALESIESDFERKVKRSGTVYDEYEYDVAPFRHEDQAELTLEGLHYESEGDLLDQILTALRCGDHIILVGPPGTGKSELARQVTEHFVGDRYSMVTATADWSTFDTIGGYRPNGSDELGFHAGVFLDRFQTPSSDPQNEWLIIDEINRANIDKAFGSLFSAIVGDSVETPFNGPGDEPIEILGPTDGDKLVSGARYHMPEDWRLIATMNTYDKTSLYEMSYAFMRRFTFVYVDPPSEITEDLVQTYVEIWGFDETAPVEAITEIWSLIQPERVLGPALFERVFQYLAESESDDLTRPLTMYVLPQLEGLATQRIVEIVRTLCELEQPELTEQQLLNFCSDYFGITVDRFEQDE